MEEDRLVVRFVSEDGNSDSKDFDFTTLRVHRELQEAFAAAFAYRTGPSSPLRSIGSARHTWSVLTSFAEYLDGLLRPPQSARELAETHVRGWVEQRSRIATALKELGTLKLSLRKVPGISPEFAAAMTRSHRRAKSEPMISYSRDEFRRILTAARFDVRRAAGRIRANRELLARWRSGELGPEHDRHEWRLGRLLDHMDRHADIPRYANGGHQQAWVEKLGTVGEHVTRLHLGARDIAAFAVLLTGLTGENPSTITKAPAAHHRPDGYSGEIASAIVELDKPRRQSRRHMDVALTELPDWAGVPADREPSSENGDDLHSAFGVYMLLHDLAGPARDLLNSPNLFAWWALRSGRGAAPGPRTKVSSGHIKDWAQNHDLPSDRRRKTRMQEKPGTEDESTQLTVTLNLLRHSFLELNQKPVAHSTKTLANNYLLRERGNLTEYQQVVADVLEKEVKKAQTRSALPMLSTAEVEQARVDPAEIAERYGLDAATLKRMLDGDLDTVVAACSDNTNSPHSPPGTPCRASFMLCLSCPCARALPHHLPVQVAVHDAVQAKQDSMAPLRWAERFALPHTQLADLLDSAGPAAVTDARKSITADQNEIVERFLNRELDLS
ncbi:hypothetical protein [Saccharothrix lopnurensis]|uniref:Uncharacterized protein n=1 Tax=Saccharothrix lopnurensis TaxID=1670621 RepID=A0ABW1P0H0_9PSEU